MNSTSTTQSVISRSTAPLTSLTTPASSSFAAVGTTLIETIISTVTESAASSAETATDDVSLSSVIIESDRQASPSTASPMSTGVQAEYVKLSALRVHFLIFDLGGFSPACLPHSLPRR
ncbi:uncharacterized protein BT62DRAFT_927830 [Guyanagaster necrorhizus]|uniref:Uncharacterized protein n=1 Tax=Guyanagaster necrorhizus TaxID=856835 RepID=A0A9P7W0X6_9AGAR|nr:uncharacterized protein BT62DRAFT_927830 [Guyanagaster necrorhizus MCA 3950]KAG7450549.1 hypothetical protein BT62DRAFT_927830 [Guyanagaster necrorhizus MCA 3950]